MRGTARTGEAATGPPAAAMGRTTAMRRRIMSDCAPVKKNTGHGTRITGSTGSSSNSSTASTTTTISARTNLLVAGRPTPTGRIRTGHNPATQAITAARRRAATSGRSRPRRMRAGGVLLLEWRPTRARPRRASYPATGWGRRWSTQMRGCGVPNISRRPGRRRKASGRHTVLLQPRFLRSRRHLSQRSPRSRRGASRTTRGARNWRLDPPPPLWGNLSSSEAGTPSPSQVARRTQTRTGSQPSGS